MTLTDFSTFVRTAAGAACFAFGMASAASATTLGDVTLGATALVEADDLDVFVVDLLGDQIFEANDFFGVFVLLDFDEATETSVATASPSDLEVDDGLGVVVEGSALDFAFDFGANTLSILYDLGTNDLSADPFGVAILSFGSLTEPLAFEDLDGELADFALFGATESVAVVPLPATLPLALAGVFGLAWIGRRRQTH